MGKLNCFVTENNLIECFYLYSSDYNVAIFNENLTFLEIIEIDNVDEDLIVIDDEETDAYIYFINAIHLCKEIGIFTYYKIISGNPILILQINELIFNGSNYLFKEINEKQKILITLNNSNYYDYFYLEKGENLMKIQMISFLIFFLKKTKTLIFI